MALAATFRRWETYRPTTAADTPNPALRIMACSNVRATSSAAAAGVMSSEMTRMMPTACRAVTVATASNIRNRESNRVADSSATLAPSGSKLTNSNQLCSPYSTTATTAVRIAVTTTSTCEAPSTWPSRRSSKLRRTWRTEGRSATLKANRPAKRMPMVVSALSWTLTSSCTKSSLAEESLGCPKSCDRVG